MNLKKTVPSMICMLVLLTVSVSAAWPLNKDATCNLPQFNVTGQACDQVWCGIIDCSYDLARSACICGSTTNQTNTTAEVNYTYIIANVTASINISINTSEYYNRSQVDIMIDKAVQNATENLTQWVLNLSRVQRDNFLDLLNNKTFPSTYSANDDDDGGIPAYAWILGLVIAVGATVMLMSHLGSKKTIPSNARPRKIQSFKKNDEDITSEQANVQNDGDNVDEI